MVGNTVNHYGSIRILSSRLLEFPRNQENFSFEGGISSICVLWMKSLKVVIPKLETL